MNDSEIWEPWKPTVGQRVRVRLSGECCMDWAVNAGDLRGHPTVIGHPENFDGAVGTIDFVETAWPEWASHPYGLRFDTPRPCVCGDDLAHGGWFAAIELEPV